MNERNDKSNNEILNNLYNSKIPSDFELDKWDDVSESGITYLGYAVLGTDTADRVIKKIDENTQTMSRAVGLWDDRTTLTYP